MTELKLVAQGPLKPLPTPDICEACGGDAFSTEFSGHSAYVYIATCEHCGARYSGTWRTLTP